jgi:hypothetical protein
MNMIENSLDGLPEKNISDNIEETANNNIMNTESNIITEIKKENKLTTVETAAIRTILYEFFSLAEIEPSVKKNLYNRIKKDLPSISDKQLKQIWRDSEEKYYEGLSRPNPTAVINKLNDRAEKLIDKVLEESEKDATVIANTILNIDKHLADIHQVTNLAPSIEVNFKQEIPTDYLLNPGKFEPLIDPNKLVDVKISTPKPIDGLKLDPKNIKGNKNDQKF